MRHRARAAALLAAAALCVAAARPAPHPWDDRTLGADARARLIVNAMTLDEKLAVVALSTGSELARHPGDRRVAAGFLLPIRRLGLPGIFETDASLGVANANEQRSGDVATALPSGLATASSFDPASAREGGAMIGAEARAKGFNVMLAGGANLIRDPWAGRSFEYFSEDALLTGAMAGAQIAGVQSNAIVSTLKHFAINPQETGRTKMSADIEEAELRESDLLALELAFEKGRPASVMCGYNRINGDYACENRFLLTDVLKRDWRFPGYVMSDWGAVHSTVTSIDAGLDQQSGKELDPAPFFGRPLRDALVQGQVSAARLDDMVRRVLRSLIAVGAFDQPPPVVPRRIDYTPHLDVSQRAAEAGMVLLKNDGTGFPIPPAARRILVVGGHADQGVLSGGGSSQVRPVSGVAREERLPKDNPFAGYIKRWWAGSSPLAAIRARAGKGVDTDYIDGRDRGRLAAMAKAADAVVVFAEQWRSEAMDVPDLLLPDDQDALIEAAAAANPKTIVVLETGGAVLMPWLDRVAAVVEAWYPGDRGGPAIARLLFGDYCPAGRLPVTFPADALQSPRSVPPELKKAQAALRELALHPPPPNTIPDVSGGLPPFSVVYKEGADTGYRWYELQGSKPLFPFGYGLSCTRFAYRDLKVSGGRTVSARFTVTNTGGREGADVPQLYAAIVGRDTVPIRRLIGFERVTLKPGESRTVTLAADPRLVAEWDTEQPGWHVHGGDVPVILARDAADTALTATARLADRRFDDAGRPVTVATDAPAADAAEAMPDASRATPSRRPSSSRHGRRGRAPNRRR